MRQVDAKQLESLCFTATQDRRHRKRGPRRGDLLWEASQIAPAQFWTLRAWVRSPYDHKSLQPDADGGAVLWEVECRPFWEGDLRILMPASQDRETRLSLLDKILRQVQSLELFLHHPERRLSPADLLDICAQYSPTRFHQIDVCLQDDSSNRSNHPSGDRVRRTCTYHLDEPELAIWIRPGLNDADCLQALRAVREQEETTDWGQWPYVDSSTNKDDNDVDL